MLDGEAHDGQMGTREGELHKRCRREQLPRTFGRFSSRKPLSSSVVCDSEMAFT